jgi:hypothetical protein
MSHEYRFDAPVASTALRVVQTTTCSASARTDARSRSLRQTRTHMRYAQCARCQRQVRRMMATTSRMARRQTAIRLLLHGCEKEGRR